MDLFQRENVSESLKDLADTVRVDPLDSFNKYKGGFDITNKHYWSSTVYTGIYGYAIGAAWLLCGIIYATFLIVSNLFRANLKKRKYKRKQPCSWQCHFWPLLLVTSLTLLAIVASGIVLGGNLRFHSRAKKVMNIIIDTADGASSTIYNVTGAMRNIRDNLETSSQTTQTMVALGFNLNSTSNNLDAEAAEITMQAEKNRRLIDKGLKLVYIVTTLVISINLVAVIALSATGFLKWRRTFYMFVVLCWLLAIICWVYFGLYFFLEKFVGDTCTALEDFQQDPHNNSLSSILPCNELSSAKSVLLDTRVGIYNLITEVNANISAMQSSVPILFRVCNPFSAPPEYHYQPNSCTSNTIKIGDIPQVIQIFTCSNGDSEACNTGEFITTDIFNIVKAYTSSIQNLLDIFPGVENLVDCGVVTDAFTEILSKHCKPVKKYVTMVWLSTVVLATIIVILIFTWTGKSRYDDQEQLSDGFVKPYVVDDNTDEIGKDRPRATNNQIECKLDP
ncbi:hypothetical protein GIB67_035525 [Kingdonia uniflora]|uniref:Transmembrane protein n=1 Tax=Kingdonia uniflora TaxID=39325 RepID=A0A7J7MC51_9MAGN|nr:hypothetical protein GIB67_035525 [Kingdonia uniflora]